MNLYENLQALHTSHNQNKFTMKSMRRKSFWCQEFIFSTLLRCQHRHNHRTHTRIHGISHSMAYALKHHHRSHKLSTFIVAPYTKYLLCVECSSYFLNRYIYKIIMLCSYCSIYSFSNENQIICERSYVVRLLIN